jgi:hypothetical protein
MGLLDVTWPSIDDLSRVVTRTTITVEILSREPSVAEDIVLHEYLHHMDNRFNDIGVPYFYNPDDKPSGSTPSNYALYETIMRRETDGSAAPYRRLHGTFGRPG